jgi:hypothetical protein
LAAGPAAALEEMIVRKIWPWIRTLVAFPLGFAAVRLTHLLGQPFVPLLSENLPATDLERTKAMVLIFLAGVAGGFVIGAIARHRLWLHMVIFFVLALRMDLIAMAGAFADQPFWFRALVLLTLPLQVWLGALLAGLTFTYQAERVAAT